jgi:hypothetical protein
MIHWNDAEENEKNEYWNSLSGMHTLGKVMGFLEFVLKGLIIAYLAYDYKQKNPNNMSILLLIK